MPIRFQAAVLAVIVALLALPAASQAVIAGGADDGPDVNNPQQDVRSAAVIYEAGGGLRGAVALAAAPTFEGLTGIAVDLGVWSKPRGWCSATAEVDLRVPDAEDPEWFGGLYIGDDNDGLAAVVTPQGAAIEFDASGEGAAGQGWNCAWAETFGPENDPQTDDFKTNDKTDVFSLTPERARDPRAEPECSVTKRRVAKGKNVPVRCSNVSGPLTVRVYRGNKLKKTVALKRGKVSTRGLSKGVWRFLVWRGSDVLGVSVVKIR